MIGPARKMLRDDSDRAWKRWGALDPYYAVCTQPQFQSGNIDEASRRNFFDSGEKHVEWILRMATGHLDPDFRPRVALDFGCGVGRIVIPLARRCERVIGVDVSDAMLEESRKNLLACGLANAEFVKSDDSLSQVSSGYDFVHSCIVFQHIPPSRGLAVTRSLIAGLHPGGIGALHYVILNQAPLGVRISKWVRKNVPLSHGVLNILRGRSWSHPLMQMNVYSLNRVFDVLYESGCSRIYSEFTNDGGYVGAILLFRKDPA